MGNINNIEQQIALEREKIALEREKTASMEKIEKDKIDIESDKIAANEKWKRQYDGNCYYFIHFIQYFVFYVVNTTQRIIYFRRNFEI